MSDTESDDEFLSADEGENENSSSKNILQEEEVDEIMGMLMNNEQKGSINDKKMVEKSSSKPSPKTDNQKQSNTAEKSEETYSPKEVKTTDFVVDDDDKKTEEVKNEATSPGKGLETDASDNEVQNKTETCKEVENKNNEHVDSDVTNEKSTNVNNRTENEAIFGNEASHKVTIENSEEMNDITTVSCDKNQIKNCVQEILGNEPLQKNKDKPVTSKDSTGADAKEENAVENMDNLDLDNEEDNNGHPEEPLNRENNDKTVVSEKNEIQVPLQQDKSTEKEDKSIENMDNLDLDDEENDNNLSDVDPIIDNSDKTTVSDDSNENNVSQQQDNCTESKSKEPSEINKEKEDYIVEKLDNLDLKYKEDVSTDHAGVETTTVDSCDVIISKGEAISKGSFDNFNTENDGNNKIVNVNNAKDSDVSANDNYAKEFDESSKVQSDEANTDCKRKVESPIENKVNLDKTNDDKSNDSTADNGDGWGWDNWADDFIIQAAGKVSTLLETVEGQLGIPDPKAMAQVVTKEEKQFFENQKTEDIETDNKDSPVKAEVEPEKPNPLDRLAAVTDNSTGVSSWFSGFSAVSSITGLVQNTGTDLVSGGIGALEFIGKKTVDMLSEGDPGLRGKRDALTGKKTNTLSAALKEAKRKSEQQPQGTAASQEMKFVDLFEKYQGNAHLDALEMLSSDCDSKLTRILNIQSSAVKEESMQILSEVRNNFELDEGLDDQEESKDFKKQLFAATKRLKMKITCSKVLNTWTKLKENFKSTSELESPKDCFDHTLASLAELSSRFVEFQRKVADMLILTDMQAKELAIDRASALKSISEMFILELTALANGFAQNIADKKSEIITDIYLESSNCVSMVKDCHDLLLPILKCSIIM